jgi:hypothetical protein
MLPWDVKAIYVFQSHAELGRGLGASLPSTWSPVSKSSMLPSHFPHLGFAKAVVRLVQREAPNDLLFLEPRTDDCPTLLIHYPHVCVWELCRLASSQSAEFSLRVVMTQGYSPCTRLV